MDALATLGLITAALLAWATVLDRGAPNVCWTLARWLMELGNRMDRRHRRIASENREKLTEVCREAL